MSHRLFADYCQTTLAGPIASTDTSCTLIAMSSVGPPPYSFPAFSSGMVFTGTFVDAATGTVMEQVLVTAWNVGTNTISAMTRGINGTTAQNYLTGDKFQLLLVANTDNNTAFLDQRTAQQTPTGAIDGVNANYSITPAPIGGIVYVVNGITQSLGVDYTITAGTITKLAPLLNNADTHWVDPYFY